MPITGTHFNYYLVCKRKLWLFANNIQMEHTSDLVYEGNLIHEDSYPQRSEKYQEVQIAGIKVDYFDTRKKVIHEIKKSDKIENAHVWQLKYYMYIFEEHNIEVSHGILEYPKLRKTDEIVLSNADRKEIKQMLTDILKIVESDKCPPIPGKAPCKNCSYYDFCFVDEVRED